MQQARDNTSDQIRQYVVEHYLTPARKRGERTARVVAGDIHRALHFTNRVPLVCAALKSNKLLRDNGLTIVNVEGPPSGLSTKLVITYRLPADPIAEPMSANPLLKLRGIARDVFRSLGGGTAFIREERAAFRERLADSTARTE